jgi:hypothetical protein
MLTDFSEKLNIKYEIYVILTSKNGMPIYFLKILKSIWQLMIPIL